MGEGMRVIRFYVWDGICWRSRVLMVLISVIWAIELCRR